MSINPETFVPGTFTFYTHVDLYTVDVHTNISDNILSVLFLVVIFVLYL